MAAVWTAGPPLQNFTRVTQARKHSLLACCPAGKYRLTDDKEFRMVDQNNSMNSDQAPSNRRSRRGALLLALVAVALLAGISGNLLSKAFGQGDSWHHISRHHGGVFGGSLSPAQIDDRIDRMTKHMAIELDATPDQQVKVANILKAAVADLRPLHEKARATRAEAVTLLTAPTMDRSADRG